MKIFNKNLSEEEFFIILISIFFFIILLSVGLTIFNLYIIGMILFIAWAVIFLIFSFYLLFKYIREHDFFKIAIILIAIIAFFLAFCFFSDYGIEGGHDPGNYFQTAAHLSKTHSFLISYQNAITYPGTIIFKQHLTNQFPPAYPVFLSYFYFYLSLYGVKIATSILMVLSLICLYLLFMQFKSNKTGKIFGLVLLIFFVMNYYTLTFFRSTYIEGFYLFLVLFLFLVTLKGMENPLYFIPGFITVGLIIISRPEAILNLIIYSALAFYLIFKGKKSTKRLIIPIFIIISLSIIVLSLYNLFVNPFLITNFSNIANSFKNSADLVGDVPAFNKFIFNFDYVLAIFSPIGFILMLIFSMVGFKRLSRVLKYKSIILIILIAPQIVYIINAGIAFYLPWFMRRFFPTVFILALLLFFLVISNSFSKRFKLILIVLLLFINILPTSQILLYKEYGSTSFLDSFNPPNINSTFIFLDRFGAENYASTLFFTKGYQTIYDRTPVMDEKLYACLLFNKSEIFVVTTKITPYGNFTFLGISLNKTNLVYNFSYKSNYIQGSCDVRRYVYNPEFFTGYGDIFNDCKINNPPTNVLEREDKVFIYSLKLQTTKYQNCSFEEINLLLNHDRDMNYLSYKE